MNWNIFDYNLDKSYYLIHSEKVQHPNNPEVRTQLLVESTFNQIFRVICGSELQYKGTDRDEVTKIIKQLRKGN